MARGSSPVTTGPSGSAAPAILRSKMHYGSPLFGYAVALALIFVSGAFRMALIRQQPATPFLFFYPAIALASYLAGVGPGLIATAFCGFLAVNLFPDPPPPASWIALAVVGPLFVTGFAHLRLLREEQRAITRELATFKFISDHATDWILMLDDTGNIRYANLRACSELGYTDKELVGRHIASLVPESERTGLDALLQGARSGAPRPIELTFVRHDKPPALVELGCTSVRTGEDRVIHAAARDISERKRMEEERQRIDVQLREVRYWENLGALARGMAHDFNNLLTSILGYASLARDLLPDGHEAAPMLESIVAAGERSADLVRMLLATSGYRPRHNERLQLDKVLDWMLANRPLPPKIHVVRDLQFSSFGGDRRSFETLLWSLITNAAESYGSDEGTVRVTIRSALAPQARGGSFEEGNAGAGTCLGIIVEDSGCGMKPDVLNRAFDPFFSTKFPGRGLGLPAVRGIVRAYSGRLLLETAPGHGTRVEVWLPLETSAQVDA